MLLAGVVPCSVVDGPGCRYTIFTQGCSHKCPGCQNPHTWSFNEGVEVSVESIVEDIVSESPISRVTISGGDPFYQEDELLELCRLLKSKDYNIWVYTGFLWEDIKDYKSLQYIDVVVDGPFELDRKTLEIPFVGSSNQRIIDVQKSLESGEVVLRKYQRV